MGLCQGELRKSNKRTVRVGAPSSSGSPRFTLIPTVSMEQTLDTWARVSLSLCLVDELCAMINTEQSAFPEDSDRLRGLGPVSGEQFKITLYTKKPVVGTHAKCKRQNKTNPNAGLGMILVLGYQTRTLKG